MNYMVHEILSFLFNVFLIVFTWWGWTLFDDTTQPRWIRIAWLVMMVCLIVVFLVSVVV